SRERQPSRSHGHDAAQHDRSRAGRQADGGQRAADQLRARYERSQDLSPRDAERAEELDQTAQIAELAQARAEELEPDPNANHQPGDPIDATEPGVDATHEVHGPHPRASSMIGTGRPAIFYCEEQDSDVEDCPERLKHDKDPVEDEERMSEEED